MSLETGSFVNDLTPSNPLSSDPAGQGDDHLRLIKSVLVSTFPQMGAVLGQVRSQDVAVSISSTWNTNHFVVTNSATASVVLTLPPASSITSGFFVEFSTLSGANISLLPSGAASINGAASFSIPPFHDAIAFYQGSSVWRATKSPNGLGSSVFGDNVTVAGTLSVSGATVLAAVTANGAGIINGALTVAGTTTLSGTVVLSNGQLQFPASQNASANANTLDDYEEGTWTPTLTFASAGDVNVAYSTRVGNYTKIGDVVHLNCAIGTSTFLWTTSSGVFRITGLPFTSNANLVQAAAIGPLVGIVIGTINSFIEASIPASTGQIDFGINNIDSGVFGNVTSQATSGAQKNINLSVAYKV